MDQFKHLCDSHVQVDLCLWITTCMLFCSWKGLHMTAGKISVQIQCPRFILVLDSHGGTKCKILQSRAVWICWDETLQDLDSLWYVHMRTCSLEFYMIIVKGMYCTHVEGWISGKYLPFNISQLAWPILPIQHFAMRDQMKTKWLQHCSEVLYRNTFVGPKFV